MGKTLKGFLKWRELPELKDDNIVKKCNKFHHLLTMVGHKYLRISQEEIKKRLFEGTESKRGII